MASSPSPLSPEEVASRLRAQFGDDIRDTAEQHGHAVVSVSTERYRELVTFLRDDPGFACDYCDFTGGVDWGKRAASRCSPTSSPPRTITTCA